MVGWSGHFRKSNIVRPYCGAEQPRPLAQFATICTSTIFTARSAFRSVSSRRDPERFLDEDWIAPTLLAAPVQIQAILAGSATRA
jgi:hypothetical protein